MNIKHYLFIGLSVLGLASCTEEDDEAFDEGTWRAVNEAYFEQAYQAHPEKSESSFILPSWTQPASLSLSDIDHTKSVLVDVVKDGTGDKSPYYTDTVLVHYVGRLIPTEGYPDGYEFDKSYLSAYDPDVDVPYKVAVNGVVEGFSTALQHMNRGDEWIVTVPYQLGYGTSGSGTVVIPGYSTLIFQIRLVDFWTKKRGDRKD